MCASMHACTERIWMVFDLSGVDMLTSFTFPIAGLQKVKEAYLPFWVSSALLRSHLHR